MSISSERVKLYILVLLLALLCVVIAYHSFPLAPATSAPTKAPMVVSPETGVSNNSADVLDDDIVSIELIDVNFWEARFKVRYQQSSGRTGGYLAIEHRAWTPNVGLMTSSGIHEGVTLLNRHFGERDAYTVNELVGRMYNPYRQDKNYAKRVFPVELNWPSREAISTFDADNVDDALSQISQVVIFRNVPRYIEFAEQLTAKGFPPEKIYMSLAVCPNCVGSLIYGEGVQFEQLQAVLAVLKQHDFPLATVSFSDDPAVAGQIQIGNSPLKGGKALWANIEALLDAQTDEAFFAILGYPLQSPATRARQLLARAKDLINSNKQMEYSRQLLDEALQLDDSYVPIYLEMARHLMRTQTFSEGYVNDEVLLTAAKAEQLIRAGLTVDSEYADAYVLLGYVLAVKREFEEAEAAFNQAEALGTDNLWLPYNRALMFLYQNRVEEAITEYSQYLSIPSAEDDNDRPIQAGLNKLSGLYLSRGEVDKAFSVFEETLSRFPNDSYTTGKYLRLLVAYGGDPARIEALLQRCKSCRKRIEPHIDSMQGLLAAAELVDQDSGAAQRAVIKAQALRGDFLLVVADMMKGELGRSAVEKLVVNTLIDVPALEHTGSLAYPLVGEYSTTALSLALTLGADPNLVMGRSEMSPLMQAVVLQRLDMIEILLVYGGDPNLENEYGVSALTLARSVADPQIIAKLEAVENRI
ncbi:hypothetical protein KQ940_16570 [Marinobacterium sp. D7]|uniref:ankyrin repeat domain-containing protein n=1 Tax=Marinobacterium ramblicola TaxID=2849041 RepID=UPI001C2D15FE|nr:ankyrin repeat domain-containing protein [Marinobacterium ramblicola]MBV1789670.1 hypothetical protein [Marinobacterium ramblicola]